MPKNSRLVVCDVNHQRRDEFVSATPGLVEVAESPRIIAENCVSRIQVYIQGNHTKDICAHK